MNTSRLLAQATAPVSTAEPQVDTPEARMQRRFPQKVRTGDLIGLPIIDDDNREFATIRQVVRSPEGRTRLIVSYGAWFGWFGRLVAVPIEVVAIVGKQVASLDMQPDAYRVAPTWMPGQDAAIPSDEIIRIALTRR